MKLLITGALKFNDNLFACIAELGHTIVFMQKESDPIPVPYEHIEGVICNALFLYHDIEKFENLKYIQLTSAGLDRVPLDYINANRIKINNAVGVYSIPMAEFALSSVLSVYKQADFFKNAQNERRWAKHRGLRELYGKRVCIIGCGNVGSECAKRFQAMGCDVVGLDIQPRENEYYSRILSISNIREVLPTSDVVILTVPLTEKTYHLMDSDKLSLLPEGCILVNIARGGVVDTNSLIYALQTRNLIAVLDVFEDEPLSSDNPLWGLSNAVLTPHNSFVSAENNRRLWNVIICNLTNID